MTPKPKKKITPMEFAQAMRRKRVERVVGGAIEYRAHHGALGVGWLCLARWTFTPDEGRPLEMKEWTTIVTGRVMHAIKPGAPYYPGDLDYTTIRTSDGTMHEFRYEFVSGSPAA